MELGAGNRLSILKTRGKLILSLCVCQVLASRAGAEGRRDGAQPAPGQVLPGETAHPGDDEQRDVREVLHGLQVPQQRVQGPGEDRGVWRHEVPGLDWECGAEVSRLPRSLQDQC